MIYVNLFEKIKWASEQSGLSIKRIAERAGVKPSTLHEAIRRGRGLDYRLAIKLTKELRVSADWLLDDDLGPEHLTVRPPWLRDDQHSGAAAVAAVKKAHDRVQKGTPAKKTKVST